MNYVFEVLFIIWGFIAFLLKNDPIFAALLFAIAALFNIAGSLSDFVIEYRRRK